MTESTGDTLLSHLIELRDRLIRIAAVLVVAFIVLFFWSKNLYDALAAPMLHSLPANSKLIATDITAPFFVPMKVTFLTAFLVTLPHTLYQIWAFVAPGLYAHERRLVLPLVVSSTFLFFVGMSFAYFFVFPVVFKFMASVTPTSVEWMADISKYLDFVIGMFIAFGVTFETPVFVVVLVRMGVVQVAKLKEIRPYVIVCAFIVAAVVTPPDVVSQMMLAVPLWLLYELGVLCAGLMKVPAR